MDDTYKTVGEVVRTNVRRLREERHITRAELAELARGAGFDDWTDRTVERIEEGNRRLTLEEFHALPVILFGVTFHDLYEGADAVAYNDHQAATTDALKRLLAGRGNVAIRDLAIPGDPIDPPSSTRQTFTGMVDRLRGWDDHLATLGLGPSTLTASELMDGKKDPATIKMAKRNGWDVRLLVRAAHARYGHTIGEQCELEASKFIEPGDPPRTIQARRGAATRNITRQMERILDGFD